MEQVLQYLRQADGVLKGSQAPKGEEKELFLQNVFSELDGYEYRLTCSHDGSAFVEDFLREASKFQLAVFFDRLAGKYASMATHRYASHVMETVFECSKRWLALAVDSAEETVPESDPESGVLLPLDKLVLRAYDEMKETVTDAIMDAYGSHVWRSLLSLAAKVDSLRGCVSNLAEHLLDLDDGGKGFLDLSFDRQAAPFFQILLELLRSAEDGETSAHFDAILNRMLGGSKWNEGGASSEQGAKIWKEMMEHEVGSRTAETIITLLSPAEFQSFYTQLCRGQLASYAKNPSANYALQKILLRCHNASQFELMMDELKPIWGHVITWRRFGVLIKVAEWAAVKNACHGLVLEAALDAFGLGRAVDERQLLFSAALRLQGNDKRMHGGEDSVNLQGCLFLSQLARFPAETIRTVVDGLLRLNEAEMVSLARHPAASRTLEAFLSNPGLGAKALQRIGRHFKGHLISLACDRNGSHVVERLWKLSPLQGKNSMMEELLPGRERLESTPQGRLVIRNCRLEQFARHREDWEKEEKGKLTKRALFEDILNDGTVVSESKSARFN